MPKERYIAEREFRFMQDDGTSVLVHEGDVLLYDGAMEHGGQTYSIPRFDRAVLAGWLTKATGKDALPTAWDKILDDGFLC